MLSRLIEKWQKELDTVGFIDHQKGLLMRTFIKDLKMLKKHQPAQLVLFK